jgi:hypothetical protein
MAGRSEVEIPTLLKASGCAIVLYYLSTCAPANKTRILSGNHFLLWSMRLTAAWLYCAPQNLLCVQSLLSEIVVFFQRGNNTIRTKAH